MTAFRSPPKAPATTNKTPATANPDRPALGVPTTALAYGFARAAGLVLLRNAAGIRTGVMRVGVRQSPQSAALTAPLKTLATLKALAEVRRVVGQPIAPEPLSGADFDKIMSDTYAIGEFASGFTDNFDNSTHLDNLADSLSTTADLLDSDDEAPVIRLINGLIAEAIRHRGSDIHIEPFEESLSVRLRIDGVLKQILSLPARTAAVLVSRIKVMARLDIAEKRLPQDGRISLALGGRAIDVRVSTLPSRHGERVVLRLLDRAQARFSIEELGMSADVRASFIDILKEPNGILLVTGPTGSGKTTTLYAGLSILNDRSRNILTVEDPVEYALDGIGQTQVNSKVGMTFATGLRAMLRQDPDVVMVGEIRDQETAEIAVQASLTGHLVLSTVHTNAAISAITRLRDMGIESFLLSSTIKAILAQRLVRRLCLTCRKPTPQASPLLATIKLDEEGVSTSLYEPGGCADCAYTGFKGRVGIYELVRVDPTLRQMIHDQAAESTLAAHAFRQSKTLLQSGLALAATGMTAIEEVRRVCRSDGDRHGDI